MSVADYYCHKLSTRFVAVCLLLLLRDAARAKLHGLKNNSAILIVPKITKPCLIRFFVCRSIHPILHASDPPAECVHTGWAMHDTLVVFLCWIVCTRRLNPTFLVFIPLFQCWCWWSLMVLILVILHTVVCRAVSFKKDVMAFAIIEGKNSTPRFIEKKDRDC